MATIRPIHDKVLVKRKDAETSTMSNIIIPDQAQVAPDEGVVLAVGPGAYDQERGTRIPMQINIGDTILFTKYGGVEIEVDGESVLLLAESEIYGTVER